MKTLERKVQETVEQVEKKFGKNGSLVELEKTSREFEKLVKKGVVDHRGNRLLSASDRHLKLQVTFNARE